MKKSQHIRLSWKPQYSTKDYSHVPYWIPIILALISGALTPTQAAINNKLTHYAGNPMLASFISFCVGTVAILCCLFFTKNPLASVSSLKDAPLISWAGGLCGAFFVTAIIIAVPRLGMAMTFSLVVLGQMLITLPIDHYGFLGAAVKPINFLKIVGILLVIAGVILIRKSN